MPTFSIADDCDTALSKLFTITADGSLQFGWSAISLEPATHQDLLLGIVRFGDYIMEGFLTYGVHALDLSPGCVLSIEGEGSNRDWSIHPQVRRVITAAGLVLVIE